MDKRAAWLATKFLAKCFLIVGAGAVIAYLCIVFPFIVPAFVTILATAILCSIWYLAYTVYKKSDDET